MGTVFNKHGGGSNTRVINLGSGTSFNVTQYSGYKSFNANNFIVCAKSGYYTQLQSMGAGGGHNDVKVWGDCRVTVNKSYNANSGVLSASETVQVWGGTQLSGGNDYAVNAPTKTITNPVQVYLVIGKMG